MRSLVGWPGDCHVQSRSNSGCRKPRAIRRGIDRIGTAWQTEGRRSSPPSSSCPSCGPSACCPCCTTPGTTLRRSCASCSAAARRAFRRAGPPSCSSCCATAGTTLRCSCASCSASARPTFRRAGPLSCPSCCAATGTTLRRSGASCSASACTAFHRSGGGPTSLASRSALCRAWDSTSLHTTPSRFKFRRAKGSAAIRHAGHETRRGEAARRVIARSTRSWSTGSASFRPCRPASGTWRSE
jgi:hypothetical protein